MVEIPFKVQFEGGEAAQHRVPAYDGYTSLAGFALTLSLVSNYA